MEEGGAQMVLSGHGSTAGCRKAQFFPALGASGEGGKRPWRQGQFKRGGAARQAAEVLEAVFLGGGPNEAAEGETRGELTH